MYVEGVVWEGWGSRNLMPMFFRMCMFCFGKRWWWWLCEGWIVPLLVLLLWLEKRCGSEIEVVWVCRSGEPRWQVTVGVVRC